MSPLRPGGAIDNLKSLVELMKLASDILHGKQEIAVTIPSIGFELPAIRVKVRPVEGQGDAA